MKELTQAHLKEVLRYDPETGHFTRLKNGERAGGISCSPQYPYIQMYVAGKAYLAHRLAWLYVTGEWPIDQIDHINHVGTDNSWVNLRQVTHPENQRNRPLSKKNTSGHTGVTWLKNRKKWHAAIGVNGKWLNLGSFKNIEDAVARRKVAEVKYDYHENHGMAI